MRPPTVPTGLQLARASRLVSRAFDEALAEAGGTLPIWLVLLNVKTRQASTQRELARAVGIREATLTHHLNTMEAKGLLTRRRDPTNRRIHVVELTAAGEQAFVRLRSAAIAFNRRLSRGLSADELGEFEDTLCRLAANVGGADESAAPWAGLIERPRSA